MTWKPPKLTSDEIDVLIRALEHRGGAYDLRLAAKLAISNGYFATAASLETEAAQLEHEAQKP